VSIQIRLGENMVTNKVKTLIASLAFGSLIACGGGGGGTTTVSFGVTDAPVDDAEAVVVTFSAVDLLDGNGDKVEGFTLDTPVQVDLLALQGANSEFLVTDVAIEPGEYQEIRLIAEAANPNCNNLGDPVDFDSYITVDGTKYALVVPSGAQTGLKVKGPIAIAAGARASFIIDFDLRKAISERGNKGCYNLSPVLRVVDQAQTGTLQGTVDAELLADSSCTADTQDGSGAAIYLFDGIDATPDDVGSASEPFASSNLVATEGGDFTYEIGFLLEGSYTAALTCQAGDDVASTDDNIAFLDQNNVSITADGLTTSNFEVAEEAPPLEAE